MGSFLETFIQKGNGTKRRADLFHYLVLVVLLAVRILFIFWFLRMKGMKVLKVDLGLLTDSITILPASLFSAYF